MVRVKNPIGLLILRLLKPIRWGFYMNDALKPEQHTEASNRAFMGWLALHGVNPEVWIEKKPLTNEELERMLKEIE